MKTILVTEHVEAWRPWIAEVDILSPEEYLTADYPSRESIRVINLCTHYTYQSVGYYVSLLAAARNHRALPSVLTTQDFNSKNAVAFIEVSLDNEIQDYLKTLKSDEFELSLYFGKNIAERYSGLCKKLYGLLPLPLFRVYFKYKKTWRIDKIKPLSIEDIPYTHMDFLSASLQRYLTKKRFYATRKKTTYFDMAILQNPQEKLPPSNEGAIKKFIKAANKLNIAIDLIDKNAYKDIGEYDALFIRETTSVNHYTYRFARRAMSEDLVVMDDPISILKCSNKVYLAELMQQHHINTPQTILLNRHNWKKHATSISYPCVIKQPDGFSSIGVVKADNADEFTKVASKFLKTSELILAQPFMPTDYDWRIGIIDHKPLYACRYHMAKDHWQVLNWNSEKEFENPINDAVALSDVPPLVIQTALKAARLMGNGLYGVDLKEINNKVYVIEVNDNPTLEAGVEDLILGDTLYETIMSVFLTRIKQKHGYE